MTQLIQLSLAQALMGLKSKTFSARELTQSYLDQIEHTKAHNAYITVTPERALADAARSDEKWANGSAGALEGIPIGVKDAYCTKDILTTAASKMLHNFVPPYESTVTEKVFSAGAVLLGKTNLDEFCMGSTTTPVHTGPTHNPWDTSCTAGGSSGGSAAAVANGSALISLGTDTGGSVRQPAAFCGVVGVKPSYGRCSRWGVVAYASSLDTPGPLARTVEDSALLLNVMSGHDAKDATSLNELVPDFTAMIGQSIAGKKVGIPKEWYDNAQLDPVMMDLWKKGQALFQEAGCDIVYVSLPYSDYALPCYYILACAEAASNLQRYDGVKYGFRAENIDSLEDMYFQTRGQGFGPEVKRRILIGTYVLSHGYYEAYYGKAQKVRHMIQHDFRQVFQQVDVVLTPTTPTPAFSLAASAEDPVAMYWNDVLTVPVNVGNVTAISVPAGISDQGLPLGLQLIAPTLAEDRLFQFGHVIEQCTTMPSLPFSLSVTQE
jgi:aspartyl-tRNA(Asn)/glutamyl-tRNA(Gln) amidotransferase subunit A